MLKINVYTTNITFELQANTSKQSKDRCKGIHKVGNYTVLY